MAKAKIVYVGFKNGKPRLVARSREKLVAEIMVPSRRRSYYEKWSDAKRDGWRIVRYVKS